MLTMRMLLLFLLSLWLTSDNTQAGFRAEFNYLISETPSQGGDYRLKGLFVDGDALGFSVDSVNVGYYFYDSRGLEFEIVYSNKMQPLIIEVDRVGHSSGPTTGIGLLTDRTINISLPYETSKISQKLQSFIESEVRYDIDDSKLLRLADLIDVDTTGETAGSILLYDTTSQKWEAQANSIDNLTDGYKFNGNIVLGRPFVRKPTGVDYGNIFIGVAAGPDSLLGYANIAIGQDVFRSFIADPISQGNANIAIGEQAMNKTLTGFQNVAIGRQALKGNLTGNENIALGRGAGYNNFGESDNILTNYNQGVYIGTHATPRDTFSTNELVFGYNAVGNGSNTATFGNNSITATYLKGTTNLRGYGAGNKEATDLTKTRSAYIAAFATDGTLLELDTTGVFGGGSGTAFTLPTDSITFNDNNADAVEGKLQYNSDYGTLVFGAQNNTPIHIGSDMGWYVKNQTGSPIAKGVPVYASGTDGASGRITIALMIADNSIPAKFFLGVTAEAIANGADGLVWSHGKIRPLSLTGFSAGDVLYVSPTIAGAFTATEPTAPNLKLPVGFVVNNTSNGTLAVRSTIGNYLADAHDVQISGASSGQVLKYDGTKWVNGTDEIGSDTNLGNADLGMSGTGGVRTATFDNNTLNIEAQNGYINLGNIDTDNFNGSYLRLNNINGNTLLYGKLIAFGGNQTEISGTTTGGRLQFISYGRGLQNLPDDAYLLTVDETGFVQEIPVSSYLTSEVDGSVTNEGSLSVAAGTGTTSVINSNTSGSAAVTLEASTGLTIGETGNIITLTNSAPEATTAGDGLTLDGSEVRLGGTIGTSRTVTLNAENFQFTSSNLDAGYYIDNVGNNFRIYGQALLMNYGLGSYTGTVSKILGVTSNGEVVETTVSGGGISLTDLSVTTAAAGTSALSYNNTNGVFTFTPPDLSSYLTSEVDGSVTNEGSLSVTAGTGTTSVINSNTSGSAAVTLSASTGLSIGESGNTITLTNSAPEATTASGGLTETGNNIALGGTLNSSTVLTLPTDGTFTISNTGGDGTGFTINEGIDATVFTGLIAGTDYGSGTREAADIGKTNSAYFARFATDGTVVESTALTSEVDGSITNEGALSIGTGVAGSSVFIQSNTSASTPVTISVGAGFDIAASGSTIFLNPEPFAIETGTSGAISWGSLPQRIHVLDFGANTSITLSFTNVAIGGIYTLRVTGNSGTDTLVWPGAAKFEDGTSAGTVTLQDGGQMFTFYWDGTNYWVK
jgi:hypothetical protein